MIGFYASFIDFIISMFNVIELEVEVIPVSTHAQLADQFTKGLPPGKFQSARKTLMKW